MTLRKWVPVPSFIQRIQANANTSSTQAEDLASIPVVRLCVPDQQSTHKGPRLQMMRDPWRLAGGRCLSSSPSMATLSLWASTTMGRPPSLLLALHSSVATGSTYAAQPLVSPQPSLLLRRCLNPSLCEAMQPVV